MGEDEDRVAFARAAGEGEERRDRLLVDLATGLIARVERIEKDDVVDADYEEIKDEDDRKRSA